MPPFNSGYSAGVSYTPIPITPSDTVDISTPCRVVDVIGGGNVSLVNARGETVVLTGVPAGYVIKSVTKRINATGTTATGIISYP